MIKNSKQYNATIEYATRFKASMDKLESRKSEMEELEFEFAYNSYLYQYNQLNEELVEYRNLKNQKTKVLKDKSIDKLAQVIIQARIAKGWTQGQLAEKLEKKQQQIQRYEATNYESADLAFILDVIDVLELKIELKDIILPSSEYKIVKDNIIPIGRIQEKLSQEKRLFAVGE